jgi:hypothetical protein
MGVCKEVKLKPSSEEDVASCSNPEADKVIKRIDQPVIVHLEPIYLHIIHKFCLFFHHEVMQENWKTE